MSVEVALIGRLGNNLFQYSLGRIIAETLGLRLECRQVPLPESHLSHLLRLGPSTLEACRHAFPGAPLRIEGVASSYPREAYVLTKGSGWSGQTLDLPAILANRTPRRIILAGYFQRSEFYLPYRERIRRWFANPRGSELVSPAPEDVLVSIRRGRDFDAKGWTLPTGYYRDALSSMRNVGRVYVAGTGVDESVHRVMSEFAPTYLDGTPEQHLQAFPRFKRFVLSNSTFSWWTAFLSEAVEVIGPEASPGMRMFALHGFLDVDLRLPASTYRSIALNQTVETAIQ